MSTTSNWLCVCDENIWLKVNVYVSRDCFFTIYFIKRYIIAAVLLTLIILRKYIQRELYIEKAR